MRGQDIVVFDIETVPDRDIATDADLLDPKTGEERFPPPPLHKIVAIAIAEFRREDNGTIAFEGARAGGLPDADEPTLIRGFWSSMTRKEPTFVGFNSRGFDFPVLVHRSMRHGIEAPLYFSAASKWDGYRARYATDWHLDLADTLSEFGGSRRISLDLAARLVGAPGKLDVAGDDVEGLVAAGRIEDVRAYCVTDTVSTAMVWLAWLRLQGELSAEQVALVHESIADWLTDAATTHPQFAAFLAAWRGTDP